MTRAHGLGLGTSNKILFRNFNFNQLMFFAFMLWNLSSSERKAWKIQAWAGPDYHLW